MVVLVVYIVAVWFFVEFRRGVVWWVWFIGYQWGASRVYAACALAERFRGTSGLGHSFGSSETSGAPAASMQPVRSRSVLGAPAGSDTLWFIGYQWGASPIYAASALVGPSSGLYEKCNFRIG